MGKKTVISRYRVADIINCSLEGVYYYKNTYFKEGIHYKQYPNHRIDYYKEPIEEWLKLYNQSAFTTIRMGLSIAELYVFKEWYGAICDLNPAYLERKDHDLYDRIMALIDSRNSKTKD